LAIEKYSLINERKRHQAVNQSIVTGYNASCISKYTTKIT